MSDQNRFVKLFQAWFERRLELVQTMNEAQVLRQLQAIQAGRKSGNETLSFLHSVSLKPSEDLGPELNQLRAMLNSAERSSSPFDVVDYFEEALKKRLETLRKQRG